MRSRPSKGRLAAVAAAVAGTVLGAIAAGGSTTIDSATAAPPPGAGEHLAQAADKIEAAQRIKKKGGPRYVSLIRDAIAAKHEFMEGAFGSQALLGCNANKLLRALEDVDVPTTAALLDERQSARQQAAEEVVASANALKRLIGHCSGAKPKHKRAAAKIVDLAEGAQRFIDSGKNGAHEFVQISELKKQLLAGTRVYGCEVWRFYHAIDEADQKLYLAGFVELGKFEDIDRETYLRLAHHYIEVLDRLWTKVPCGEGGTTTAPVCSDGAGSDYPGNQACLSPQDTTDQSHSWTFHYPGEGATGTDFIDFKAAFKEGEAIVANAYRVFFNPTVHESASVNHGAAPISGTMPCDGLSGTTIRAGIGSQAPTGGALPPAPGEDHMRVVIDSADPAGGTDCGSATVTLQVAADTR